MSCSDSISLETLSAVFVRLPGGAVGQVLRQGCLECIAATLQKQSESLPRGQEKKSMKFILG